MASVGRLAPTPDADTRTRLLRAAASLFARKGTEGVRNHEIHTAAGQRNESALHYYFGNRRNLVRAVLEEYDVFFGRTAADIPGDAPDVVIEYLIERLAYALHTPEGRDWLRVVSEVMSRFTEHSKPFEDTNRATTLAVRLEKVLPAPAPVVMRRTYAMLRFVTAQMAEFASLIEERDGDLPDEREFLDDLVSMSLGILTAPVRARHSDWSIANTVSSGKSAKSAPSPSRRRGSGGRQRRG